MNSSLPFCREQLHKLAVSAVQEAEIQQAEKEKVCFYNNVHYNNAISRVGVGEGPGGPVPPLLRQFCFNF